MTDQPTETATEPPARSPLFEVVPLEEPIVRGEQKFEEVTVRRPMAPDLLGLSMRDIMDLDAATMFALLPRITTPALIESELAVMATADLFALSVEASNFLLPKSVRPASLQR